MNSPFPNKKFIIDTNQAPRAIGPYSQAVGFGGLLFVSGQIPVDPKSGEVTAGGVEAQTRQVMNNLQAVLMAAGLDFSHVLKTTVYLRNMNDYQLVNDTYSLYFDYSPPARVCIEVSRLPKDVLIEVDAIAAAPTDYESRASDAEHGAHPGPDEWEAQHLADAEAAHAELAESDESDDDTTSDPAEPAEESPTADDSEGGNDADDDAESVDTPEPQRERHATEELDVDDLKNIAAPAPPKVPKINVPKPKKRSDD